MGYGFVLAVGTAASLLAGTVSATAAAQETSPAAGIVPAVAFVEDAEPVMPAGGSPNFVPPARDAAGYATPNRNLSPEEMIWHVRVALNVAALGCRGADGPEMVNGYNALLTADKDLLASASTAMGARYKARYGSAWQARHDDAMTKLYNFWALPPVQAKFCGTALLVLRESATVQPAAFAAFAAQALPRLEAPMIAFFGEFDAYIGAREAWRTRRARAQIAAAVPTTPGAVQAAVVSPAPGQAVAVVTPLAAPPAIVPVRAGAGEP
ncbi:hypothetical protein Q5H91_15100 [Sphingomonas sp. KR1UV-12]|uniref:Uncharacterized protein n=1 Tax=Sphingomonas aurea TaxID=3063994 RepID=A0ABT9ENM2_9SPHN|nr:hypothetical protein [Sphingomonas sp. KR1UV-12]MDP1028549.1 hypothetical protein [Sphingomonas sp. KR1UV-12]